MFLMTHHFGSRLFGTYNHYPTLKQRVGVRIDQNENFCQRKNPIFCAAIRTWEN